MKEKLLSFTLAMLLILTLIPCAALAENVCGDGLTWTLSGGVLSVSGSGRMSDYSADDPAPWADEKIRSVIISEGVTSIGEYAFYFCSFSDISLPASLESIGTAAFAGCTGLKTLALAENNPNFTSDGGVLYGVKQKELIVYPACRSGESFTVADGTEAIREYAFSFAAALKSVFLPDSVKTLGSGAFLSCKNLSSVRLPQGISELPPWLFSSCSALTAAEIPQSVTKLGAEAFKNCAKLSRAGIPAGMREIGADAFFGCGSVSGELTLPNGLTKIGKNAFGGTAPSSVSYDGTFEDWVKIGGKAAGFPEGTEINCLRHTHGFGAWKSDGAYHWHECSSCGEVRDRALHTDGGDTCSVCGAALPELLAGGSESGYDWTLTRSGVLTLSGSSVPAFMAGEGTAPWYGFREKILSAVIGVASLGANAFEGCTKLAQVKLLDNAEKLDLRAFSGCAALSQYSAADGNAEYSSPGGVLMSADGTRLISYPPCRTGSAYSVPETVTSIGEKAFSGADLESVSVPDSVTEIGKAAFSGCTRLKTAALPEGLQALESSLFSGCSALSEISIPESATRLESAVFSGCSSLKKAVIPNDVTVIPSSAFSGCSSLAEITIPANVTAVGERAFDGCTALKTVIFLGTVEQWSAVSISGSNTALIAAEKTYMGHVHSYSGGTVVVPTCTVGGYTVHKCSCGSSFTDSPTAALGHSYSGGYCTRCGAPDPDGGGQQGHVHDFRAAGVTAPTCTADGYTTYKCSCGASCTKDHVTSPGHVTELKGAVEPGCLKGGRSGDEVCTVCGKTVTAGSTLPALGHAYELRSEKQPSCTESGYSGDMFCTRCGDITELGKTVAAAGHKFSDGRCTVCGAYDPGGNAPVTVPVFDDVEPGMFCYDAVQWAVSAGITNGTGPSTFSPKAACTRYQIVMFMWRAAGCPSVSSTVVFTDVSASDIFCEAVRWAVSSGITRGTTASTFSPYAACTRGQIVTFLYRAAGSPTVSGDISFGDVAPDAFCRDAVIWAAGRGITKGTTADSFSPGDACTRAQVVTFLYRANNTAAA